MVDPHKNAASNRGVRFSTCTCTKPRRDACGPTCLFRPLKKRPPVQVQRRLQDVHEIVDGLELRCDVVEQKCPWCCTQDGVCWCEDDYDFDYDYDYEFVPPAPFKLAAVFMAL